MSNLIESFDLKLQHAEKVFTKKENGEQNFKFENKFDKLIPKFLFKTEKKILISEKVEFRMEVVSLIRERSLISSKW
ncbi:hypothetical protein BpHYR1_054665 [Brachionus plicatilis]|uniref:Uncharacterized protein n=1 Tax=Brachionus plicatilis TaxID=10195 RepID=A0A3M7QIV8_BRAPC|nr:hypothetical protein BpHYR1_054665 [Brachionus plicatilis]